MKKILAYVIAINDASFPWYVAVGLIAALMSYVYPPLIHNSSIHARSILWFIGISAAMKITAYAARRGSALHPSSETVKKTVARLRPSALAITGTLFMIWALFGYAGTVGIYGTLGASDISINMGRFILFVLYSCVFMGAIQEIETEQPSQESTVAIKGIYEKRREYGQAERLSQSSPLRQYVHTIEYAGIAKHIQAGDSVLDVGCGDGSLATLLTLKRADVTACDISAENIAAARAHARENRVEEQMRFLLADAENLPFPDNSFDWVVSSHVLEHLPHLEKGLAEIRRVTKKRAIIAMPTCMNPCAAVILGGDSFWVISRWSATAWFVGLMRIILNLGGEGVDERYAGDERLPHVWHYPWIMRDKLKKGGFRIRSFEASSICLPYFNILIPFARKLERYKNYPLIRNLGYGSIAMVEK